MMVLMHRANLRRAVRSQCRLYSVKIVAAIFRTVRAVQHEASIHGVNVDGVSFNAVR